LGLGAWYLVFNIWSLIKHSPRNPFISPFCLSAFSLEGKNSTCMQRDLINYLKAVKKWNAIRMALKPAEQYKTTSSKLQVKTLGAWSLKLGIWSLNKHSIWNMFFSLISEFSLFRGDGDSQRGAFFLFLILSRPEISWQKFNLLMKTRVNQMVTVRGMLRKFLFISPFCLEGKNSTWIRRDLINYLKAVKKWNAIRMALKPVDEYKASSKNTWDLELETCYLEFE